MGLFGRFALSAALLALAIPGLAQDAPGETYSLKSKFAAGDKFVTDANMKMAMDLTLNFGAGGEGANKMKVTTETEQKLSYSSEIVGVTDKNLPQKERREFTTYKITVSNSMSLGDMDNEAKPETQDHPLEGKTFELVRDEDSVKVTPKSDVKEIPAAIWKNLKLFDHVTGLLPAQPVAKGGKWSVQGKDLLNWISQQVEMPGIDKVTGTMECTLSDVSVVDKRKLARVTIEFDLELTVDPSKLAAQNGGMEGEEEEELPEEMRPKGEMSMKVKKGKGEFLFDVEQGAPVSLDMKANMEIDITQSMGENEVSGKGKGTVETNGKWALKERK